MIDRLESLQIIASVWRDSALVVCLLVAFGAWYVFPVWFAPVAGFAFAVACTICLLCSAVTLMCRWRLRRLRR